MSSRVWTLCSGLSGAEREGGRVKEKKAKGRKKEKGEGKKRGLKKSGEMEKQSSKGDKWECRGGGAGSSHCARVCVCV